MANLIELKNVNLSFNNKVLFKDFNLTIREGEKILISGKSGHGKTTLIKILLGFQNFNSGTFLFKGKEVAAGDYKIVRNQFAFVNQDVTLRPLPVNELLEEIAIFSNNKFSGKIDEKLISFFNFTPDLFEKKTTELSGGERQRLGIMIAIMLDRPIFLLDEITSALDLKLVKKVIKYFSDCDKTVIAITHNTEWLNSSAFKKVSW